MTTKKSRKKFVLEEVDKYYLTTNEVMQAIGATHTSAVARAAEACMVKPVIRPNTRSHYFRRDAVELIKRAVWLNQEMEMSWNGVKKFFEEGRKKVQLTTDAICDLNYFIAQCFNSGINVVKPTPTVQEHPPEPEKPVGVKMRNFFTDL